jgi:hypothetical protein
VVEAAGDGPVLRHLGTSPFEGVSGARRVAAEGERACAELRSPMRTLTAQGGTFRPVPILAAMAWFTPTLLVGTRRRLIFLRLLLVQQARARCPVFGAHQKPVKSLLIQLDGLDTQVSTTPQTF